MDLLVNYTQEFLQKKDEAALRTILFKGFNITKGVSQLNKQQLIDLILKSHAEKQQSIDENKGINENLIYKDAEGIEYKVRLVPETDLVDEYVELTDKDGNQKPELVDDFLTKYTKTNHAGFSEKMPEPSEPKQFKKLKNEKAARNVYQRIHREVMQRFGYVSTDEDGYLKDKKEIYKHVNKEFAADYGFKNLGEALNHFKKESDEKDKKLVKKAAKKPAKKSTSSGRKPVNPQSKSQKVIAIVHKFMDDGQAFTSGDVMKKLKQLHGLDIHRSFCITLINKAKASYDAE